MGSIKRAETETLVGAQFLVTMRTGAFHIEITTIHCEVLPSHLSPPKSAFCPALLGK